ncbi:MAG TPA: F0F1 ATP synthase subunit A [Polyangiaceae bacterium]|jgi:F-type H+-transporting ATPase subunit a
MPEHTSFFSYLIAMFPAFGENMHNLGHSLFGKPVGVHSAEPVTAALAVALLVVLMALGIRGKLVDHEKAVIPDDKLTLRTFFEILIGTFYDMMKDMMGPKRAKRYFPIIGTCACFIFFGNLIGLFPGFTPPTSSWNITLGCAIVVFVAFNYYGIKENGLGYFKHFMGPMPALAPLIFPIEILSICIRPITLSIRLMLNMAVDHLLVSIAASMFVLFLPIPIMVLSTLVIIVQVVVFCLLSSIYIALSTEHEEHDHGAGHGHAHTEGHGHEGHGHEAHGH